MSDRDRLNALREAAIDMLSFGTHEGVCNKEGPAGSCTQHLVVTHTRALALQLAIKESYGT